MTITLVWMDKIRQMEAEKLKPKQILTNLKEYGESEENKITEELSVKKHEYNKPYTLIGKKPEVCEDCKKIGNHNIYFDNESGKIEAYCIDCQPSNDLVIFEQEVIYLNKRG